MFNLKQYIKEISWPIVTLFFLSLFILAYLHNEYLGLAVLSFILISFSALLTFCKRKRLKKYLLTVEFAALFLFLFLYPGFTVILLIAILHSFLYFYRAEKKYELQSILLTFTISLVFVYLILTANIIVLTYLLENMFSFILTMPLDAAIFVVFYILISTALLKKAGIYDFESYFRFKKLRFLNIFISKTKIRSTVKIALLVFFIFLIISIFPAYYLLFSVEELYKVVYETKEDFSERLVYHLWKEESMPGFENNLKEKGYENISRPSSYSMEGFSKVNETAFYVNCTNQFECEKLPNAYHSPKINTTDFLQERYLQAHKNGEVHIFELPEFENYEEKKEEVINQKPNASFYPEFDTQGIRYINNIYGKRVVNLLNYSLPQPEISLYLNYNGIPLNESIEFLQKYIYYVSASEITESAEYIYPSEKKMA